MATKVMIALIILDIDAVSFSSSPNCIKLNLSGAFDIEVTSI